MEDSEEAGESGFTIDRGSEFTITTRYHNVYESKFPFVLNFKGARNIEVLVVERDKQKRKVVQGSE